MTQLTITVTIDIPDNQDDKNKLVAMLRHADNAISHFAHERIGIYDSKNIELGSALNPPYPIQYEQRIAENYREAQAWNTARMKAAGAVWQITYKVMGLDKET